MAEFGLTPQGFRRKRYADIIAEKEARARMLFGEDVNLSDASPLGKFIKLIAWEEALVWQMAEDVYNAAFVDTAEGINLDRVGLYIGIVRRPAQKATGVAVFEGDDGIEIPEGFRIATKDDIEFETIEAATITDGTATVSIRAVEPGVSGNVPAGTITEIMNPTPGINSVTNPEATTGGLNKETDSEFRARYMQSVAKAGASTVDSIRAALLNVPGVRAVRVIENTTMQTVDGRPPKSIECYLLGGDPKDIAYAILRTKAAGIQAYGQESVTVKDDSGQEHQIGFTYANEVLIEVNITVYTDERFKSDGEKQIRTAIVQYIGGQDKDGQFYVGLSMGMPVIYNEIIRRVMSVEGVLNTDITINKEGETPGKADISIDIIEVAETRWDKVTVSRA